MTVRKPVVPLTTYLRSAADRGLLTGPDGGVSQVLAQMVTHPQYPCLGARSVFRRRTAQVLVLEEMGPGDELAQLSEQLMGFAERTDPQGPFASFIVSFRSPAITTEEQFESLLWQVLQGLHDGDEHPWADRVSADPLEPHFAFSHAGTAFFIVGCTRARPGSRDAHRYRRWYSTCTSSSSCYAPKAASTACGMRFVRGTRACRARSTRWRKTTATVLRPVSTPVAP